MTEFKFACPVCGQHITCDSIKSGAKLDCPTCFQKLVVPQSPADDAPKLILAAAQVHSRPLPKEGAMTDMVAVPPASARMLAVVIIVVLVCAVGALFAFRGKIFKASPQNDPPIAPPPVTTNDPAWKLDLTDVTIPDTPVAGRISGRVFNSARATLEGGKLIFNQRQKGGPEVRLTISLFARTGGELAGKFINIETNHTRAPAVAFRWKDNPQQPATKSIPADYALRLQFGAVAGGRLPGTIYFCALDEEKSWVAGTFEAEIQKAPPPKPQPPGTPKP
ncbi:MAG: hypothetical protein MUF81_08975 [Verrucomicrobia bacterium]|jgi:hypothetical protein|nr:hypothetical protein [Verrucomicrobiota bacterium]